MRVCFLRWSWEYRERGCPMSVGSHFHELKLSKSRMSRLGVGGTQGSPRVRKIIDVVTHGHEQVKEQLPPHLHFHLHGSATLECLPAADN
jgi:hypothetical protein